MADDPVRPDPGLEAWLAPSRRRPVGHQRGEVKLARLRLPPGEPGVTGPKPPWLRIGRQLDARVVEVMRQMRERGLHSVCEEADCPNLGECFGRGTATFMILGDVCTRRCPFCDVAHGRPAAPDPAEPARLVEAVAAMGLDFVVITSVDRDDLRDGGAGHFAACIRALRDHDPSLGVEILVPDFRGRVESALARLAGDLPDVFNHNLESVPRLYPRVRPGSDYRESLDLLRRFKQAHPAVPTKSGLMLGLGETLEEVEAVMRALREHGCGILTLGQYLAPSPAHLPVQRYLPPEEFEHLRRVGEAMGFSHVASGPLVRSSYHAAEQAAGVGPDSGEQNESRRP